MQRLSFLKLRKLDKNIIVAVVVMVVMLLAFLAGRRPSIYLLLLPLAGIAALVFLARPYSGLFGLVVLSIMPRVSIGTGTEVSLNLVTLLIPALLVMWAIHLLSKHVLTLAPARTNLPLLFFLMASFISLLAGNAMWDPAVPRPANLLIVQFAQWGLFAFSAGAFLLFANVVRDIVWLRRLTFTFLLMAAPFVVLRSFEDIWWSTGHQVSSGAIYAAPFWVCVGALAGGQLVFNRRISSAWRILLAVVVGAIVLYSLQIHEEKVSHWMGITTVIVVLVFLRLSRMRWLFLAVCIIAVLILYPVLYEYAGGDEKWQVSGASRLVLSERVIEMTSRNPVLGLGPASYRHYGFMQSLKYGNAFWLVPNISSHNNYVDIYAQTGVIGLGLFLWFIAEVAWLGWRLRQIYPEGFASGYINGMLAALGAICVIMMFLDWFLPFVYDVGFNGFQASVLVWMFLGGLVSLDAMAQQAHLECNTAS